MQPVGSTAVRTAIEQVQPLLGLQGALATLDPKSQDKNYVLVNG